MEEGNSDQNRDRKGKGKMYTEDLIILSEEESPEKKDSQGNQNVVHEGSSSSVQENETAPVVTNVSVSPMLTDDVVSRLPQVQEGSSSFPNTRFRPASRVHGTVAEYAESSKKNNQEGASSAANQHQCRYCNLTFSDSMAFLFHEASHVAESHQYHKQRGYPPYDTLRPGYYTVPPITPRLTYTPHGYPEIDLDMTNINDMSPIEWFQRFYHNFHYRSIYGEGGSSSDRASQRPRTNSSLSMTQTREQGRNDGTIDLQLRVGMSSSLENQDRDGGDHDHDHNNEGDDDGVYDPFSGVVWKPSK